MSYENTLIELPTYSHKQLEEVRKRCALLMQSKSSIGNSVEEADWVLEGILHECEHRGIYVSRGFHLKRSGSFGSFATKSEQVRDLLTECAPGLTPVQRVALGQVCARELANLLQRIYGTPNFDLMMTRVHMIPEAVEQAFPGYMASRLLGLTVAYDAGK